MALLVLSIVIASAISTPASANICSNDHSPTADDKHIPSISQLAMVHSYHLVPSDDDAWMGLLPRKARVGSSEAVSERDWAVLYRTMKHPRRAGASEDRSGGGDVLKEFSLEDVRVEPDSVHGRAQQTNLEYLLFLDPDSLVWTFRKQAGLPTEGDPYGGWEKPDGNIRGHFIGHYLSSSAMAWASTHNETLRRQMTAVVDALDECQKKMGTGYLSAVPTSFFDTYEEAKYVWAPYYTIHKIMAGLLDQHTIAGNTKALRMVTWMAEYFGNRVVNLIKKYTIARHWRAMNIETGGMNDVLYKLYSITEDEKHLMLAHLFDKPCFLGPLAVQADDLSGLHANTHIPIVVGAQTRYEITGDPLYKEIGKTFMDIVNSSHVYATGGTGVKEFWTNPNHLAGTLHTENQESCTTYNMLKVSRNLFRWTKGIAYADYYERALTNSVLGIQRGREPGVMIYFIPMIPGGSKAINSSPQNGWGNKTGSFWCCYGTGIESFSKLGDSIYFEEEGDVPKLYVIQFISSTLNWKSGGMVLHQRVEQVASFNQYLKVTYTISANESKGHSQLSIRLPSWASNGIKATLNADNFELHDSGKFWSITRRWFNKDNLTLQMPIGLRTEAILDDRNQSTKAILFGPYLLAGLTCGAWELRNDTSLSQWILPVPAYYNSQLISLAHDSPNGTLFLSSLNNSRHDSIRTLTMEDEPKLGTNSAAQATFKLVYRNKSKSQSSSTIKDVIGESVSLEPFDLPGRVIHHEGPNNALVVMASTEEAQANEDTTSFRVSAGLDGREDTASLESESASGCFVHSGVERRDGVRLVCRGDAEEDNDREFEKATSFRLRTGFGEYHPISFVAGGVERNFLLQPVMSLRDETYTIYFNMGI